MSKKASRLESLSIDSGRGRKNPRKIILPPHNIHFFQKCLYILFILISYLQAPKTYIMPLIFAYCNFKGFFSNYVLHSTYKYQNSPLKENNPNSTLLLTPASTIINLFCIV